MGIFLHCRGAWTNLHKNAHKMLHELCGDDKVYHKHLTSLRKMSVLLFGMTFCCHSLYVALDWTVHMNPNESFNATGHNEYCYTYFSVCLNFAEEFLLWAPLLDGLFILSQQVLICGVLIAIMMLKILNIMDSKILLEIEACSRSDFEMSVAERSWMNRKLLRWTTVYTETHNLLVEFNAVFSSILLVSVGLDVLTTLGNGGNLLQSQVPQTSAGYYLWNCVVFLSYSTILFIPFVLLLEKVEWYVWVKFCSHLQLIQSERGSFFAVFSEHANRSGSSRFIVDNQRLSQKRAQCWKRKHLITTGW